MTDLFSLVQGYSALAVVEALARERGLHRVPVIDSNRRIVNLVTNSQVLKYLNDNIDLLGSVLIKTLDACGNRFLKPVSVQPQRDRGESNGLLPVGFRLTALLSFVFACPALVHPPSFSFPVSLTVDEETAAIDAFQLMVTKDVDGLAICNKEGRLRGNISLRDRQSGKGTNRGSNGCAAKW